MGNGSAIPESITCITGTKSCFKGWARASGWTLWAPLDGEGAMFAVVHSGHGVRVPDDNGETMEQVYFCIV